MTVKVITKKAYDAIDECECGGPIFKYQNTSSNVYYIQCGYFNKVLEIDKFSKKKLWIDPKKKSCNWRCVYHGSRPEYPEIQKRVVEFVERIEPDPDKALERKLNLLFKFLMISKNSSTLDEINILVKNNLFREPRKIYYYPSIGHMRVSHYESFEDYYERIFSKKIIDLSILQQPNKEIKIPQKQKVVKTKKSNTFIESQFIVTSDAEECSDNESERSDSDESEHSHNSDYSDVSDKDDKDDTEEVLSEGFYEEAESECYDEEDYNDDY